MHVCVCVCGALEYRTITMCISILSFLGHGGIFLLALLVYTSPTSLTIQIYCA